MVDSQNSQFCNLAIKQDGKQRSVTDIQNTRSGMIIDSEGLNMKSILF